MVPVTRTSKQQGRRRLTDLCLLALFGQMPLKDRLSAHKVNSRWGQLVREASRPVRSLTVTVGYRSLKFIEMDINERTIASEDSVKLLTKEDGCTPLYPLHHSTVWNCLQFDSLDSATVQQITTIFFATTEFIFVIPSSSDAKNKEFGFLVKMLQDDRWRCQLTSFKLIDRQERGFSSNVAVFNAINALSELCYLTIKLYGLRTLKDLPILGQLKEAYFGWNKIKDENYVKLVLSLNRYATSNAGLQVYSDNLAKNRFYKLDAHLRDRIARLSYYKILSDLSTICDRFRSLKSLSLATSPSLQLFTHLSDLHQLVHLFLDLDFSYLPTFDDESVRPVAQLNSVKALDLVLSITYHSQLKWLNLSCTVPNVQAIHLCKIACKSCGTSSRTSYEDASRRDTARQCLCSAFRILKQTRVPPSRITCTLQHDSIVTAEQFLLMPPEI